MDLDAVKREATKLSPWTHLATVGADGDPDVSPVMPAWDDDSLWIMAYTSSVKVKNIRHHSGVALHWQVNESGDGVEVWGEAAVHTDPETKQRLWKGVFPYDLDEFAPDGPDGPGYAMIEVQPTRALHLINYGIGGRDTWTAD